MWNWLWVNIAVPAIVGIVAGAMISVWTRRSYKSLAERLDRLEGKTLIPRFRGSDWLPQPRPRDNNGD